MPNFFAVIIVQFCIWASFALAGGFSLMLLLSILNDVASSSVPTLGYWICALILFLVRGIYFNITKEIELED